MELGDGWLKYKDDTYNVHFYLERATTGNVEICPRGSPITYFPPFPLLRPQLVLAAGPNSKTPNPPARLTLSTCRT